MSAYPIQQSVTQVTGYPNQACRMPVSKKLQFYCFDCRIYLSVFDEMPSIKTRSVLFMNLSFSSEIIFYASVGRKLL